MDNQQTSTKEQLRLRILTDYIISDFKEALRKERRKYALNKHQKSFFEGQLLLIKGSRSAHQLLLRMNNFTQKLEHRKGLPMIFHSLAHVYEQLLRNNLSKIAVRA